MYKHICVCVHYLTLLTVPDMPESNRECQCQGTAHMKTSLPQSLTEEERDFYLDQMLDEKKCSKEKTQGRKREGSMRGMAPGCYLLGGGGGEGSTPNLTSSPPPKVLNKKITQSAVRTYTGLADQTLNDIIDKYKYMLLNTRHAWYVARPFPLKRKFLD